MEIGRLPVLSAWRSWLPATVAGFLDRSRPGGERGGDWKRGTKPKNSECPLLTPKKYKFMREPRENYKRRAA